MKFYVPKQCQHEQTPRFVVNMQKGAFYMLTNRGDYKPIECYLPAATYKTPEEYADERCGRLLTGALTVRNALGSTGYPLASRYEWDGSQLLRTNTESIQRLQQTSAEKVIA